MTARVFVLLSGGIDSSTCLFLAGREFTDVTGISVFYGQRHVRELDAAKTVCQLQNAQHHVLPSLSHLEAIHPDGGSSPASCHLRKVNVRKPL